MKKDEICYCENCGRSNNVVEISCISIKQHVAQLCIACAHVLSLQNSEARFLQLVRKKSRQQSNKEMQQIHQTLSSLLTVGTLFLVCIVAFGISQNMDLTAINTQIEPSIIETADYLTFAELNRYH